MISYKLIRKSNPDLLKKQNTLLIYQLKQAAEFISAISEGNLQAEYQTQKEVKALTRLLKPIKKRARAFHIESTLALFFAYF